MRHLINFTMHILSCSYIEHYCVDSYTDTSWIALERHRSEWIPSMFKVFLISQWKDMSCALQSVLLPCCQILPWVKFVPFIPIQRCSPFGLSFCFSPIKCLRLSYNSYLHLSLFFRGSRVLFQFLTVGFISHTTGILYMTGFFFIYKEKDKKKKNKLRNNLFLLCC